MSNAVVVFDGVWKKFRRGERHDSIRDLVPSLARKMLGRTHTRELDSDDEFWAIKDVSFELNPGEALGIIGPNGAGKSTALKLLTRILRPTRGACFLRGRVGALIEVAAGFHPDLTGRENIFLQGAIMGMKRAEIATKLDEIIEFAGVSGFVDTQVKRYSSGMNARLGFSIAAHLDPDVLIIDEVLSVGDMEFQDRCVERMREFRRQGVTIVFVSHNLQAVAGLCPSSLFLSGSTRAYGPTGETIRRYIEETELRVKKDASHSVRISSTGVATADGTPIDTVRPGDTLKLRANYLANVPLTDLEFGFIVHRSTDGLLVYARGFTAESLSGADLVPGVETQVDFTFRANVTRGHYYIECHVFHRPTQTYVGRLRPAAMFQVEDSDVWDGVADLAVMCTNAAPDVAWNSRPILTSATVS